MLALPKSEMKLVREFLIESTVGRKTLSVFQGNIFEDDSDVIGVTVYGDLKERGELYKIYDTRKDEYSSERKVIAIDENCWTGISSSLDESRHLLLIHSMSNEGETLTSEEMSRLIKITFATLSTIQYEGNEIRHIALPVLFRKGIKESDYKKFIHLYLYEATQYLRKNTSMESVKIYIWEDEDAAIWNDVLNNKTVSLTDREIGCGQIEQLKQKIASRLQSTSYQDIPIWIQRNVQEGLKRNNSDLFKLTGAIDKIINHITDKVCTLPGFSHELQKRSPFHRILVMKSQRLIIEWLADYMLSIKTFRRYIHNHSPSNEDLYQYLLEVLQVLTHFEHILLKGGKGGIEQK